jgi:hypothetical protein
LDPGEQNIFRNRLKNLRQRLNSGATDLPSKAPQPLRALPQDMRNTYRSTILSLKDGDRMGSFTYKGAKQSSSSPSMKYVFENNRGQTMSIGEPDFDNVFSTNPAFEYEVNNKALSNIMSGAVPDGGGIAYRSFGEQVVRIKGLFGLLIYGS